MSYFIYFIIFALFGCSFQSLGVTLSLYAFLKKRYDGIKFWMATSTHAMALIIIRLLCDLGLIKFGAHTIMILTCTILIGYFFIDKNIFKISLSTIGAFALVTVSEIISYVFLYIIFDDKAKLKSIISATLLLDVETQTKKALVGIPSNVILFIVALLLYHILVVKKQSEKSSNNYDGFHE